MSPEIPRKNTRFRARIFLIALALLLPALFCATGYTVSKFIETKTRTIVERAVPVADMSWVSIRPSGFQVEIGGVAPDPIASTRVLEKVGKAINVSRIYNVVEIPEVSLKDSQTHLEIVLNDQVSSIIGLTPKEPSPVNLFYALDRALPLIQTLNLVEDSVRAPSENWGEVLDYLEYVVENLPRFRLTADNEQITIDGIAENEAQAANYRKLLTESAPASVKLSVNITSPRPLIAPFEFKAEKSSEGVKMLACAATNRLDIQRMEAAIEGISSDDFTTCKMGLGAPTDHWGITVADILSAVQVAPTFKVDIRDNQVKLAISDQVEKADFDNIVSNARATLPPGFGLEVERLVTIKSIEDLKSDGSEVKLVFTRDEDSKVSVKGVMSSGASFDNLRGFAVAKFGTENVTVEPDIVEGLPIGWEQNAFTVLEVISAMDVAEAAMSDDQLLINGTIKSQRILDGVEKILDQDIQGLAVATDFEVKFTEEFSDEVASSAACVEQLNAVLNENPIQFEKGSDRISGVSAAVVTQLGQIFYNCRDFAFEIGGHTDSSGSLEVNQRLSQGRADAILTALSDLAIEFGALTARGYGPSEPVASNDTNEGRAANRRIEIRLLEKGETQ